MDTHHALVKTWLPVILLRAVLLLFAGAGVYIQTGLWWIPAPCVTIVAITLRKGGAQLEKQQNEEI